LAQAGSARVTGLRRSRRSSCAFSWPSTSWRSSWARSPRSLSEAILLALGGGAAGIGIGALATAIYDYTKGWEVVIPTTAWAGGFGAALLIGALAGLLPAIRAARLSPADALRTV
jgi:hypothetical protein